MKVEALVQSLEAISGSAPRDSQAVGDFAVAARAFGGGKTLKVFLASLESVGRDPSPDAFGPRLASISEVVDRIEIIAAAIGSKAVRDEVAELQRLIKAYPDAPLYGLRVSQSTGSRTSGKQEPLRQELVNHYQTQIQGLRLGSAELTALFEKLAADKKMRGPEMAALASAVAYETSASTKKSEALRRIRQKHEAYLTSAAKSDALKGSSAT